MQAAFDDQIEGLVAALVPPARHLLAEGGAVAGVDVPLTRRISLGAEGHLDWALVRIDGGSRWSGLASWQAGLGWRF